MLSVAIGIFIGTIIVCLLYAFLVMPKRWMTLYGGGIYNAKIRFNKENLGIKKENV